MMNERPEKRRETRAGERGLPSPASTAELSRLLWTAPAFLGGVVTYWLARSPTIRGALSRWLGFSPRPAPQPRSVQHRSLMVLRRAIVGNSKQAVVSVLGPPRTAQMARGLFQPGSGAYLQADTWYYPMQRQARTAMAIVFANGRAQEVQFIHVPF